MPDFVFDEYAMDYVPMRVMLDCDHCQLLKRVKELEAERDKLRWVCTERAEAMDAAHAMLRELSEWLDEWEWTLPADIVEKLQSRIGALLPDVPTPDGE